MVCRRALLILAAALTATSACPAVFDADAYDFPIVTYEAGEACSFGVSIGTNIIGEQEPPPQQKNIVPRSSILRRETIQFGKPTTRQSYTVLLIQLGIRQLLTLRMEHRVVSKVAQIGFNFPPQDIGLNNLVGPGLYLMEGGTFEWRVDENGILYGQSFLQWDPSVIYVKLLFRVLLHFLPPSHLHLLA